MASLSRSERPVLGRARGRRQTYWLFRRRVTADVNLIRAFKSKDKSALRDGILESLAADEEEWRANLGTTDLARSMFLKQWYATDYHPKEWVLRAGLPLLRDVAAWCIRSWFRVTFGLSAMWEGGRRPRIGWRPEVYTLGDAIEWMFWHDTAGRRPLTFCRACGEPFLPDSAHARYYCTYRCAHRAAVRAWRARKKKS